MRNSLWCLLLILVPMLVSAQPGALEVSKRPPLTPIHSMDDYSFLADPKERTDLWDRFKYVRLSQTSFLTFGAEYRIEHEWFRNDNWGESQMDGNGYLLQRFMPHVSGYLGKFARAFVSFKFNEAFGRAGGPRPDIDRDRADVHEAFVDLGLNSTVTARVGRQELVFGGGKLTTNNEGVNVRLSFDAVRISAHHKDWRVDLFASRPVQNLSGVFDNVPNSGQLFWGIYGSAPTVRKILIDTYYFGLDTRQARYVQGAGQETRHSVGTRLHTRRGGGVDMDWEGVFQFGSFGANRIRAWTVATETGYQWEHVRFGPRLGMKADVASGDGNPGDHKLETFNPLFPKGGYFSKMVLAGPYNFYDLHPLLELEVKKGVTAELSWDWFWRQSTRDGVYGIGGRLIREGLKSRARSVGSQGNVGVRWSVDPHLTLSFNVSAFLPGRFLKETGPGKTVLFVNYGVTYRL
ncbi:MAG: alginate export family protein [Chlorobia bacterium]|nr:alginate export family protein [Fimbriimonadaceae bacterium]